MKRVEILDKKRVFDGFFKIDAVTIKYERFDGKMSAPTERLCFERGDSAAFLVYNKESQRIILIDQFRSCTHEKGPGWLVEIPAGMVEEDEEPEETVSREMLEEIGYRVNRLIHISSFYLSPGGSSEQIFLYYAEVENKDKVTAGGGVETEHEDIRVIEFSLPEVLEMLESGKIQDAKTLISLMWFRKKIEEVK
jgi:ADP-ribose pyrophosphatase